MDLLDINQKKVSIASIAEVLLVLIIGVLYFEDILQEETIVNYIVGTSIIIYLLYVACYVSQKIIKDTFED